MKAHSLLLCIALLAITAAMSVHAAVIGIDAGSEYWKVAIIKPGKGFEIVTDEENRRKFPALITFDEHGERMIGSGAATLSIRRPANSFSYTQWLLGQSVPESTDVESNVRQSYSQAFLPTQLVPINERGNAVGIRWNTSQVLPTETVHSMLFAHAKRIASDFIEAPVQDCVVTIPSHFSPRQRQALLDAAELAGLNVLSLIHENTAAAIQYAINFDFNPNKSSHVVMYNMGATSTKVTLLKFSATNVKGKPVGQIEVLGEAHDEHLGGLAFDLKLANLFAEKFNAQLAKKKIKVDVKTMPRVMARLRQTANRMKEVLSANKEILVHAESLYQDTDLSTSVTQEEFYKLSADLLERVTAPLQRLLSEKSIEPKQIDNFVLVGGGPRIPRIQTLLKEFLGRESLDQNLNGDEAPALGAAFQAANLSLSFRVRPLGLTDLNAYPVGLRMHNLPSASEQTEEKPWNKRVSVFSRGSVLGRRNVVSFTHDRDISLHVFHDSAELLPSGIPPSIANINVTGLEKVIRDHADLLVSNATESGEPETKKPRVQLTFTLTLSGTIELTSAEAVIEQSLRVPVVTANKNTTQANSTEEAAADSKPTEEPKVEFTIKKKTHKFPLSTSSVSTDPRALSAEEKLQSKETLRLFAAFDASRRELADAKNALESELYSLRDKLESEDVQAITNTAQRDALSEAISKSSSWLEEHEYDQETTPFLDQLSTLRQAWSPVMLRVREALCRPDAVNRTRNIVAAGRSALTTLKEREWISQADQDRLQNAIQSLESWLDEKIAAQDKLAAHEAPAFLCRDTAEKSRIVQETATSLLKKQKPKPKPKPKAESSDSKQDKSSSSDSSSSSEKPEQSQSESSQSEQQSEQSQEKQESQQEQTSSEQAKDEL